MINGCHTAALLDTAPEDAERPGDDLSPIAIDAGGRRRRNLMPSTAANGPTILRVRLGGRAVARAAAALGGHPRGVHMLWDDLDALGALRACTSSTSSSRSTRAMQSVLPQLVLC